MTPNYRVGIYLRLSREDERTGESGSIINQRAILLNYIKENNLQFISEYVDDGVSGTTFDRVGFRKMLEDIQTKKINMIITKDTSRLGRDHIEFGYYVEKYFPEHGVRYVAVCDNIDTFYNNNDMLLFKSAYNDMYVKDISNKIRASLNIKKRNGEFVGAYAPYGYVKDPDNKHQLLVDEDAADVVRRIFSLFIEGYSITKIMDMLTEEKIPIPSVYKNMNRGLKSSLFGIWSQRTVTDILTNPTYVGNLTQGRSRKINYKSKKRIHTAKQDWIIKENACPAIVDKKVFLMAQNIYQSNKFRGKCSKQNTNLLLRGLVYCFECEHTIGFRAVEGTTKKYGKVTRIYGNCNYYLKHRYQHACTPHSIRYEELERIVFMYLRKIFATIDKKSLLAKIKKHLFEKNIYLKKEKEIKKLKNSIIVANQKIDRLYYDKLGELISEDRYLRIYNQIIEEINTYEQKLKRLELDNFKKEEIDYEGIIAYVLEGKFIDRLFLTNIIKRIRISEDKKIHIYFKIKNEAFEGISCNPVLK